MVLEDKRVDRLTRITNRIDDNMDEALLEEGSSGGIRHE